MKVITQKSLDELLGELPREVAPPRNLWRGISRRMDRHPRRVRPMIYAAAAGIMGACVATAITWSVLHSPASGPRCNALTPAPRPSMSRATPAMWLRAR